MKYLALAVLISGCGGIAVDETDEQTSLLTCSSNVCRGSVTNGFQALPSESQYFCHPTMMSGHQAHSQAPNLGWGLAAYGGVAEISASSSSPSFSAIPNAAGPLPHAGQMVHEVQCDRWSNFGGSGAGYSQNWAFNWNPPASGVQAVSAQQLLWDFNSACYITSVGSVSIGGERVFLDSPNGWNWRLNVDGFKGLSGGARCAYLGRPMAQNGAVWLDTDVHGNPASSGIGVNEGICLVFRVEALGAGGGLDDGFVQISRADGTLRLVVSGGVTRAHAVCVRY